MVEPSRRLIEMGFGLLATCGTARLSARGRPAGRRVINKVLEGRPHIVDAMKNGEVQLVFNTTEGAQAIADSFGLRRTALSRQYSLLHDRGGGPGGGRGDRRAPFGQP